MESYFEVSIYMVSGKGSKTYGDSTFLYSYTTRAKNEAEVRSQFEKLDAALYEAASDAGVVNLWSDFGDYEDRVIEKIKTTKPPKIACDIQIHGKSNLFFNVKRGKLAPAKIEGKAMSFAKKIEAHYIEAKPKAEIDTNAMSSEYNEFPTEFLAHAKRNALVFIHTAATPEGRNLDDVLKGGQLGARAQLKDIVNKSLLVVNKIEPTTGAKMKKGAYVFVGVSGLKNGVANAYVHDIKGDSAYIGSMSSHLEK